MVLVIPLDGSCYSEMEVGDHGKRIMHTRDLFHNAVKHGLMKDGWTITADPLIVQFSGHNMYIDLGAEKLIAAEKDNQQIAVEVKSFVAASVLADFHTALGQFLNYRLALDEEQPQRTLYLAMPVSVYPRSSRSLSRRPRFSAIPFISSFMIRRRSVSSDG
jgi:hypothetical protein